MKDDLYTSDTLMSTREEMNFKAHCFVFQVALPPLFSFLQLEFKNLQTKMRLLHNATSLKPHTHSVRTELTINCVALLLNRKRLHVYKG